jgi:hypothetical protein
VGDGDRNGVPPIAALRSDRDGRTKCPSPAQRIRAGPPINGRALLSQHGTTAEAYPAQTAKHGAARLKPTAFGDPRQHAYAVQRRHGKGVPYCGYSDWRTMCTSSRSSRTLITTHPS